MSYIFYKQWADHWESLYQQAIDSSLSDKDDTKEDKDWEFVAPFLAVSIGIFSFIIAMIIA